MLQSKDKFKYEINNRDTWIMRINSIYGKVFKQAFQRICLFVFWSCIEEVMTQNIKEWSKLTGSTNLHCIIKLLENKKLDTTYKLLDEIPSFGGKKMSCFALKMKGERKKIVKRTKGKRNIVCE